MMKHAENRIGVRLVELLVRVVYLVARYFCRRPAMNIRTARFHYYVAYAGVLSGHAVDVVERILVPLIWRGDEHRSTLIFGKEMVALERELLHVLLCSTDMQLPEWHWIRLQSAFLLLGQRNPERALPELSPLLAVRVEEGTPELTTVAHLLFWMFWQAHADSEVLTSTSATLISAFKAGGSCGGRYCKIISLSDQEVQISCNLSAVAQALDAGNELVQNPWLKACCAMAEIDILRFLGEPLDGRAISDRAYPASTDIQRLISAEPNRFRGWAVWYYCRYLNAAGQAEKAQRHALEFLATATAPYEASLAHLTLAESYLALENPQTSFSEAVDSVFYAMLAARADCGRLALRHGILAGDLLGFVNPEEIISAELSRRLAVFD